jgi:hypothetical protein
MLVGFLENKQLIFKMAEFARNVLRSLKLRLGLEMFQSVNGLFCNA